MGKIRVKTFDESEQLEKDKKLAAKREAKKAEKMAAKAAKKPETSAEELEKMEKKAEKAVEVIAEDIKEATDNEQPLTTDKIETSAVSSQKPVASKYAAKQSSTPKESKRYKESSSMFDKKQKYTLSKALELLKNFKKAKFDETVEIHINTKEKGINGQVVLPHGTGKTRKIIVADDAVIAAIEKGVIDFDVLVATPAMMPKLARVARVLGPRSLMPNPKNGTVSDKPEQAVEKLAGGQVNYKTESTVPVIHLSVGKISFEDEKLSENIKTVINSIGTTKIDSMTLKSTMSPGVKVQI